MRNLSSRKSRTIKVRSYAADASTLQFGWKHKHALPPQAGVVDSPQPEDGTVTFLGLTFSDVYYAINIFYWSALLVSVLTGNELLSRLIHFEHYATGR